MSGMNDNTKTKATCDAQDTDKRYCPECRAGTGEDHKAGCSQAVNQVMVCPYCHTVIELGEEHGCKIAPAIGLLQKITSHDTNHYTGRTHTISRGPFVFKSGPFYIAEMDADGTRYGVVFQELASISLPFKLGSLGKEGGFMITNCGTRMSHLFRNCYLSIDYWKEKVYPRRSNDNCDCENSHFLVTWAKDVITKFGPVEEDTRVSTIVQLDNIEEES